LLIDFLRENGVRGEDEIKEFICVINMLIDYHIPNKIGLSGRDVEEALKDELTVDDLTEILGLAMVKDDFNKVITFLCTLSAYTDDSQFNISFRAESSTGKSYIPLEIAQLFPREDVIEIAYTSPSSFFL